MENRFDLYDLPEGHEERFQAKLEPRLARARRLTRVFRWTAIAACLAAVLWLGSRTRSPFWAANSPEAVYAAYLEQVGELYHLLVNEPGDETVDREAVLEELTQETIPLYDQLPEEMPDQEKIAVLKEYYGGILDEAGQLKKELNRKKQ